MKLTDWQERLINERDVLEIKLQRINQFLRDVSEVTNVPSEEVSRIVRQSCAMESYYKILGERITNFEVDDEM